MGICGAPKTFALNHLHSTRRRLASAGFLDEFMRLVPSVTTISVIAPTGAIEYTVRGWNGKSFLAGKRFAQTGQVAKLVALVYIYIYIDHELASQKDISGDLPPEVSSPILVAQPVPQFEWTMRRTRTFHLGNQFPPD